MLVAMCTLHGANSFSICPPRGVRAVKTILKNHNLQGDLIQFGNRMDIRVPLPTTDPTIGLRFLQQPDLIVESAYDSSRRTKLQSGNYAIKFAQIAIPGFDVLVPEVEVQFVHVNSELQMQSQRCVLSGGPFARDTNFVDSLHVNLCGRLFIEPSPLGPHHFIAAVGHVDYSVRTARPSVLRAAPRFIVNKAITFVEGKIAELVLSQFSTKLLGAFEVFTSKG